MRPLYNLCVPTVLSDMVATSPNSDSKMADNLPDINVAAEFYARYDIREVLGKYVCSSVRFIGDFFTL